MPFPFVLWGAAAAATAVAGKLIYDKVTEDSGGSSSSSGPTRAEVIAENKKKICANFVSDFRRIWRDEPLMLCLKDNGESVEFCQGLLAKVNEGMKPSKAENALNERVLPDRSAINNVRFEDTEEFLTSPISSVLMTLADIASTIQNIITPEDGSDPLEFIDELEEAWSDDLDESLEEINMDFSCEGSPGLLMAKNFELAADLVSLRSLKSALDPERSEPLAEMPKNLRKRFPQLHEPWGNLRGLEMAHRENPDPKVVVCGMLKAGKSSLLNSLIGDRSDQTFPVGKPRKTTSNKGLRKDGLLFVDTPGLNYNSKDTAEAEKAYASADLLLFVHNGEAELDQQELDYLMGLAQREPDLERRLVFVISYKMQSGENLDELRKRVCEQLSTDCNFTPTVFAIDNGLYRNDSEKIRAMSGIDELHGEIRKRCGASDSVSSTRAQKLTEARAALSEASLAVIRATAAKLIEDQKEHARIREKIATLIENRSEEMENV